jgi:hypothetical protein
LSAIPSAIALAAAEALRRLKPPVTAEAFSRILTAFPHRQWGHPHRMAIKLLT